MNGTDSLPPPDHEHVDDVVRLWPWRSTDLDCVRAATTDGRIPEGTTVPSTFTHAEGLAWIERQNSRRHDGEGWSLVIADAHTDEAVGCLNLLRRPQDRVVGPDYWLTPDARGRGPATRAVRLAPDRALAAAGFARIHVPALHGGSGVRCLDGSQP